MLVVDPLLGIESILVIILAFQKVFKSKKTLSIFNVITFVLFFIGFAALGYAISSGIHEDDAMLLFLGLLGSGGIAILLPNVQYKYFQ